MPTIPDEIPSVIVAGATVKFHRSFGDYPAGDGWTYAFYANGATSKFKIDATTNQDGNSFDIVIPAATTGPLTAPKWPALFQCAEVLTNADSGDVAYPSGAALELQVEANIATAAPGFFLSHPERALAIVEAQIEARLALDVSSYTIAMRTVAKEQLDALRKAAGMYRSAVYRLKNPGKLGPPAVVAFTTESDATNFPPTWVDVTGIDA